MSNSNIKDFKTSTFKQNNFLGKLPILVLKYENFDLCQLVFTIEQTFQYVSVWNHQPFTAGPSWAFLLVSVGLSCVSACHCQVGWELAGLGLLQLGCCVSFHMISHPPAGRLSKVCSHGIWVRFQIRNCEGFLRPWLKIGTTSLLPDTFILLFKIKMFFR